MKITLDANAEFKPFAVTVVVESADEQHALGSALKHYGNNHASRCRGHADVIAALGVQILEGGK